MCIEMKFLLRDIIEGRMKGWAKHIVEKKRYVLLVKKKNCKGKMLPRIALEGMFAFLFVENT